MTRRVAVLAFIVVVLIAPAPAHAYARQPGLVVESTVATLQLHQFGRPFQFIVDNYQDVPATNVTLSIDISQLSSRVEVADPGPGGPCSRSGAIFTCRASSIPAWQLVQFELSAAAIEGAAVGPAGTIVATLVSGEPNASPGTNRAVLPVEVVTPPQTDLVGETSRVVASVGDIVSIPVKVTNLGPNRARAVIVEANVWSGLEQLGWVNCPQPASHLDCVTGDLDPGASVTVSIQARIVGLEAGGAGAGEFAVTSNGPPFDLERHNDHGPFYICVAGPQATCSNGAPNPAYTATTGAAPDPAVRPGGTVAPTQRGPLADPQSGQGTRSPSVRASESPGADGRGHAPSFVAQSQPAVLPARPVASTSRTGAWSLGLAGVALIVTLAAATLRRVRVAGSRPAGTEHHPQGETGQDP